jgi:hypothetical protein
MNDVPRNHEGLGSLLSFLTRSQIAADRRELALREHFRLFVFLLTACLLLGLATAKLVSRIGRQVR